jgi:hypothetical protein
MSRPHRRIRFHRWQITPQKNKAKKQERKTKKKENSSAKGMTIGKVPYGIVLAIDESVQR